MPEIRLYTLRMALERLNVSTDELAELVKTGAIGQPTKAGRYPADPIDKLYWERFRRSRRP